MNKYENIMPISRREAEAVFHGGRTEDIPLTLIRLAYYEPDLLWVQDLCVSLADHKDKWVRRACATCFSHLARIHGKIDREKINPVLTRLLGDPEVSGYAEDTIEDLKVFLK
jgi:hypothetical protein